jgi:hypothetical protein
MPENPYELAGRDRKAQSLVAVLQVGKITSEEAERMTSADWEVAAKAIPVNPPSPATRAIVIGLLRQAELKMALETTRELLAALRSARQAMLNLCEFNVVTGPYRIEAATLADSWQRAISKAESRL